MVIGFWLELRTLKKMYDFFQSFKSFESSLIVCLYAGRVTISNDGATIVKLLDIVHPAAKTLVEISKSQDAEVCMSTKFLEKKDKGLLPKRFEDILLKYFKFLSMTAEASWFLQKTSTNNYAAGIQL